LIAVRAFSTWSSVSSAGAEGVPVVVDFEMVADAEVVGKLDVAALVVGTGLIAVVTTGFGMLAGGVGTSAGAVGVAARGVVTGSAAVNVFTMERLHSITMTAKTASMIKALIFKVLPYCFYINHSLNKF